MRSLFVPQVVAERLEPNDKWALISITDPLVGYGYVNGMEANLKEGWKHLLRLKFHDIDRPLSGYRLIHDGHAESIVDFVEEVRRDVEVFVTHCHAGISRSAAVAKYIAEICDDPYFNHGYTLYNKAVYSLLRQVAHAKLGVLL